MGDKKLTISLVAFNGAKYIAPMLASLSSQTLTDWSLFVLDNGSTDGTADLLEKTAAALAMPYKILRQQKNVGFAAGHDLIFKETAGEYFLIMNQDIVLQPDCLERLVRFLDERKYATAAAPRLLKWNFAEQKLTDKIDSLGLVVARNRRVTEITAGAGGEVFGVSGALAVFRRADLSPALADGELFDSAFFAYKEDVDLAFRLRALGLRSFVVSDAVAYHDRTLAPSATGVVVANKQTQPPPARYHSYKNHLMVLIKNEYGRNFLPDAPFILWYEFKKFIYFLLFDRAVLAGLKEIWRSRRALLAKREQIKKMRRASWSDLRRWWN